ncbi:MAG: hypothetical protein JXB85_14630 [Anaerolineales bacterium]|nr:hypothetical protein [Anaerolineales bacterium]
MHIGMLWFDNDSRTALPAKVEKAADYYHKKYGDLPDLCLVHPSMLASQTPDPVGRINVRTNRAILPGHLWIGVEDKN